MARATTKQALGNRQHGTEHTRGATERALQKRGRRARGACCCCSVLLGFKGIKSHSHPQYAPPHTFRHV
jgi:hypothetical protein